MDNQPPLITPTQTPVQPVQPPQQPPAEQQNLAPQMPPAKQGKSKLLLIFIVVLVVLLIAAIGVLFVLQNNKANAYLAKTKAYGSSAALTQLEEALGEFSTAQNGLYKDMYHCKASSENMFEPIERNGQSYFVNTAAAAVLQDYQSAYNHLNQEHPGSYKPFPLIGGLGKSSEARKASEAINAFSEQSSQLNQLNDYSAYCIHDLYGMLSGNLTYLKSFADEATLTELFKVNNTNSQHNLDSLEQYKSYGSQQLQGFEKVNELRTQFIDGVISNLTQMRDREQSVSRDTIFALGTAYQGFAQNLKFFDDAIVVEASKQAERYITTDFEELQASLDQVQNLAQ